MTALRRRLLWLEAANGRCVFAHLSDHELDARLCAELLAWLRTEPASCPSDLRAEALALLQAADAPP